MGGNEQWNESNEPNTEGSADPVVEVGSARVIKKEGKLYIANAEDPIEHKNGRVQPRIPFGERRELE